MPTVYQARCNKCSYASAIFPAVYGAVFVDDPPADGAGGTLAGAVLHNPDREVRFAQQSDPRLVVLAHPAESHILAQTGYTWVSLARAGRYVLVRRVVCRDCGNLFDVHRLSWPPGADCSIGCGIVSAVGVVVGVWQQSLCLGFFAGYGVLLAWMAIVSLIGNLYTRRKFWERARMLDGPRCCPKCGSSHYTTSWSVRTFRCPECGEIAVRIRSVGKS